MPTKWFLCLCLAILLSLVNVDSRPLNSPLLASYDYIVVGGGPAGLTVANRLSEDPSITVLVLEAGQPADDSAVNVLPVQVGGNVFTSENWGHYTVPQTYLDGLSRVYPLGKVLGGGTVINGMLWSTGSQEDYNDWVSLGNPGWGWDDLLPYFKKSQTFTPASTAASDQFGIGFDPDVHGSSGPVNVSFPNYIYNQSANFFQGLNELGVPTALEPGEGLVAGASLLAQDLDPKNQTRSDARKAYYDPIADRENLYISTGQVVTRLIFETLDHCNPAPNGVTQPSGSNTVNDTSSQHPEHQIFGMPLPISARSVDSSEAWVPKHRGHRRVIAVEFATGPSSPLATIYANREVILAAGATHTPQILELSGVGRGPLLESFNISTIVHLPGVGYNLQDHFLVPAQYPYTNASFTYPNQLLNATINDAARAEYYANRTGPWTSGPPDGVAFPSLIAISNESQALIEAAAVQGVTEYLPVDWHPTVLAGYAAQKLLVVDALDSPVRAAYELLNNNAGSLVVSTMRPLTRGTCHIQSKNPFDSPLIDPRYGSNPIDIEILVQALLFNRRLIATDAMAVLQPEQYLPAADLDIQQLVDYIKQYGGTEYHPSGTAAMMPRELGGVVDPELLVYGTTNLRVVDASVFPIIPAAHLQAVVYAVAEKAADIIKSSPAYTGTPGSSQTWGSCSNSTSSRTLASGSTATPTTQSANGSSTDRPSSALTLSRAGSRTDQDTTSSLLLMAPHFATSESAAPLTSPNIGPSTPSASSIAVEASSLLVPSPTTQATPPATQESPVRATACTIHVTRTTTVHMGTHTEMSTLDTSSLA